MFADIRGCDILGLLFRMGAVNGDHGIGTDQRAVDTAGAEIVVGHGIAVAFDIEGVAEVKRLFLAGRGAEFAALAALDINFHLTFYFALFGRLGVERLQ